MGQNGSYMPTHEALSPEASVSKDPLLGVQLGNYRVLELLDEGGFGAVYKAQHIHLEQWAAIKILHTQRRAQPEQLERFRREAQTLSQLRHDNVVQLLDFGALPDASGFYLVMEYLDGRTLADELKSERPLDVVRILRIMRQLCAVLHYTHEHHVVHRDVKASNIIVINDEFHEDKVKLIDFGIASLRNESSDITRDGVCLGSPSYMSPEQARGDSNAVDKRSDLYSLGIVLFQMLTGRLPFRSTSVPMLVYEQVHQAAPSLAEVDSTKTWSTSLECCLNKALAKAPELRHQSAATFWKECREALEEQLELGQQSNTEPKPKASINPGMLTTSDIQVLGPGDLVSIQSRPLPSVDSEEMVLFSAPEKKDSPKSKPATVAVPKHELDRVSEEWEVPDKVSSGSVEFPTTSSSFLSRGRMVEILVTVFVAVGVSWLFFRNMQPPSPQQVHARKLPVRASLGKAQVLPRQRQPSPKKVASSPGQSDRKQAGSLSAQPERRRPSVPRRRIVRVRPVHRRKRKKRRARRRMVRSRCGKAGWLWIKVSPFLARGADVTAIGGKVQRKGGALCFSGTTSKISIEQSTFVPCVVSVAEVKRRRHLFLKKDEEGMVLLPNYCQKP
ncbi:MAG: serine/threonine protein kinase [Deltaproteobacteria bacterium]|nr:MAG: serine/threonine protein kinase [Deltaproteobacteria bacterium]